MYISFWNDNKQYGKRFKSIYFCEMTKKHEFSAKTLLKSVKKYYIVIGLKITDEHPPYNNSNSIVNGTTRKKVIPKIYIFHFFG